jgi:hypothetical protein
MQGRVGPEHGLLQLHRTRIGVTRLIATAILMVGAMLPWWDEPMNMVSLGADTIGEVTPRRPAAGPLCVNPGQPALLH